MPKATASTLLRHIQRWAACGLKDVSDVQLLQRFAGEREEAAFATLVQRHGQLVWNVCRHVLRHEQDAEDAFQATFLALAGHAGTIRQSVGVASWLYRVSFRVAVRASQDRAKRRAKEGRVPERPSPASQSGLESAEIRAVVEAELRCLPEKYQTPLVLCCLEGKSKAEAARQLGWKEGTVSGRLAEARKRLQRRLVRRGLTLSTAWVAGSLSPEAGAVPFALTASTVKAALLFTSGVTGSSGLLSAKVVLLAKEASKTMTLSKLKITIALLLAGSVLATAPGLATYGLPAAPAPQIAATGPPAKPQDLPPSPPDPEPLPPAPAPDRLDIVLERWQEEMAKIQMVSCQFQRTHLDKVFGATEVYEGTFRCLKPDCGAVELRKKGEAKLSEKIVWRGESLYLYNQRDKEIVKFALPRVKSILEERPSFWFLGDFTEPYATFLLAIKASEGKRPYHLQLRKEDRWYSYLSITPRADRSVFTRAQLVLRKDSSLPRQLWWEEPNGNEWTWDILRIDTAAKLTRDDFIVRPPAGWRIVDAIQSADQPAKEDKSKK